MPNERGSTKHTVFRLAVLLYREEARPGREIWFARSVLTSDLAFGETRDEAMGSLERMLKVSLGVASANGMGPHAWLASQRPDEARWIEAWLRSWAPPHRTVVRIRAHEGCDIEAQVAWDDAA